MITFTAPKKRKLIKSILETQENVSYSAACKLLRNKDIKVNGKRVKEDICLDAGDFVEIYYSPQKAEKFTVVYQDDNITVIDKKSGYLSEDVFAELSLCRECYFIHRLDRNTAGIMIFANNAVAEKELKAGFKNRDFEKYYIAEVVGTPAKQRDILTAYLFKDAKNSTVTVTGEKVKGAVPIKTGYEIVATNGKTSTLKVRLYTGKTHQIRAHLAFIGYPIVGDEKYGDHALNRACGKSEQELYAAELKLHFKSESPLFYLDGKIFKRG